MKFKLREEWNFSSIFITISIFVVWKYDHMKYLPTYSQTMKKFVLMDTKIEIVCSFSNNNVNIDSVLDSWETSPT